MYTVTKRLTISASHHLCLSYDSPCSQVHGHNWEIVLYFRSETLNENGMVIDFAHVKQTVEELMDHKNLNEVFPFNPTAENIAYHLVQLFPCAYKCEVIESTNNTASYER